MRLTLGLLQALVALVTIRLNVKTTGSKKTCLDAAVDAEPHHCSGQRDVGISEEEFFFSFVCGCVSSGPRGHALSWSLTDAYFTYMYMHICLILSFCSSPPFL